jgi:hypothetical protein
MHGGGDSGGGSGLSKTERDDLMRMLQEHK